MKLSSLIDSYFAGDRRRFHEAIGLSQRTIYRWIMVDAIVHNGKVYLPAHDLPPVPATPVVAPDPQRDAFEQRLNRTRAELDTSSVNGVYLDEKVQALWEGWCMAQVQFVHDALNKSEA